MASGNYRVRVFRLENDEREWVDRGTGNLVVKFVEKFNANGIQITDEASINTIFETKILKNDEAYSREGNKLILWTDPFLGNKRHALSFEDPTEANLTYLRLTTSAHHNEDGDSPDADKENAGVSEASSLKTDTGNSVKQRNQALSVQSKMRLSELRTICLYGKDSDQANKIVRDLPEVFSLLKNLIQSRESLAEYRAIVFALLEKSVEGCILENCFLAFDILTSSDKTLKKMALLELVKLLINSQEPKFFEFLIQEKIFHRMCGVLDFEEQPSHGKTVAEPSSYRQLLTQSKFVNVAGIDNKKALDLIGSNYRISFFKEVLLNRIIDEIPYGILSDFEQLNYAELIGVLHEDPTFVKKIYQKLKFGTQAEKSMSLRFVRELFFYIRTVEDVQAVVCYSSYENLNNINPNQEVNQQDSLFSVLHKVLQTESLQVQDVFCCGEIIKFCLEHDALSFRHYLLAQQPPPKTSTEEKTNFQIQKQNSSLLLLLCDVFLKSRSEGVHHLFSEIFFLLLDCSKVSRVDIRDMFLDMFYNHYSSWLFHPLLLIQSGYRATPTNATAVSSALSHTMVTLLVHILCFCIQKHNFRVKYFVVKNGIIARILSVLDETDSRVVRSKYLQLAALKFFRTILGTVEDDFYSKYIVRNDSLSLFFSYFQSIQSKSSGSLLHSVCLEILFCLLKPENVCVVSYIASHESYLNIVYEVDIAGLNELFKDVVTSRQQSDEKRGRTRLNDKMKVDEEEVDMFSREEEPAGEDQPQPENLVPEGEFIPRQRFLSQGNGQVNSAVVAEDFSVHSAPAGTPIPGKRRKKIKTAPIDLAFDLGLEKQVNGIGDVSGYNTS